MKVVFSALMVLMFLTVIPSPLMAQNAIGEHPCAADVLKLCKGKGKKRGDVVSCLNKNEDKLSAECTAKVAQAKVKLKEKIGSVRKICKEDIKKLCANKESKTKRSPKETMTCLTENQNALTPECQAIFSVNK